jgi:hypothetical protein
MLTDEFDDGAPAESLGWGHERDQGAVLDGRGRCRGSALWRPAPK